MNQNDTAPKLGHFLTHRHWEEALELLKYQLETKEKNRHFYTLEMFYYEKLKKSFRRLATKRYFNTRIANNLFYGLSKEFAVMAYTNPKSNLGLRRYNFMTCPMRVLYHAVGLYLLELAEEFLKNHEKHERICSSYGGNLGFNENKLILKSDRIYFKPHYQKFRKELKQDVKKNAERKVVIRLDIQNYFDELSIPKLLALLKEYIKPSIIGKMRYDETTQAELISFFRFVAKGALGIPQSDNNVISGFIGHLFLAFGDMFLDDELRKRGESVENHSIFRYMDDIYISITFKEIDMNVRTAFLNSLAPCISDCLHQNLGLRLNPKTRLFDLRNENDKDALEINLKQVSEGNEIADQDNVEPDEKIDNIFDQLENLKRFPSAPYFPEHRDLDCNEQTFDEQKLKDVLREVYDKRVEQLLKSSRTKSNLKRIFMGPDGFDFELVNVCPKPIIILIISCDDVRKEFEDFLLAKTQLTSSDVYLTLTYLCQTEFTQGKILNLLERNPKLNRILDIFKQKGLPTKSLGYYQATAKQTLSIAQPNIIEQIRLRILAEQNADYSVALNHLLNEIHAICHKEAGEHTGLDEFKAPQVHAFLTNKNVPNETCTRIVNLFDRRNISPVSHADPIAMSVSKEEYEKYRCLVSKCLKHLLL